FFVGNPRRGFPVRLMLLTRENLAVDKVHRFGSKEMLRALPLKPTKGSAFGNRKPLKRLDLNFYLS
ncbi:hypothetical protein, partial [Candidatus Pseudoruminococcus sp.]|uniref:hypothetical protein n=1 Tax=Candidatus Pseudoruminococcus sp. TaxID=3101048 RepID=UPI003999B593